MYLPIMPVANGVLPRPEGGTIAGVFLADHGGAMIQSVGVGRELLLCPWIVEEQVLYPVGVIARVLEICEDAVEDEEHGGQIPILSVKLEGREHARWYTIRSMSEQFCSGYVEEMNLRRERKSYPVISGAGWMPAGGFTEFRDRMDIPVTLYGEDLEDGQQVSMTANLGGLVAQEQAHTIEHAVLRALKTYGLCTVRTLNAALAAEVRELKQSVERSIRFTMPETLGITATGACGNPMTNLARQYLVQQFAEQADEGRSLAETLEQARRKAMSQLISELDISTQPGMRIMQGLKKGMSHDDTPLTVETAKRVIRRFPFEPWA